MTEFTHPGLVVCTGAMNSGKTSVINEMKARGYPTLPEVPEELIRDGYDPIGDMDGFDRERWKRQLRYESELLHGFADRALAEMVAYRRAYGLPIPDYINDVPWPRYQFAFVFEPLPWKENGVRYEAKGNPAKGKAMQRLLTPLVWNAYAERGAKPFWVPRMSTPVARANYILAVCRYEGLLLAA